MTKLFFKSQEYYDLINKILDQQYQDQDVSYSKESTFPPENSWIPASLEESKKNKITDKNGMIDLTDVKSNMIKNFIIKYNMIKIGNFLIKKIKQTSDSSDICIYEEKKYTQNGINYKMMCKLDLIKDIRFAKCEWKSHFNLLKHGRNIDQNIMINIIRWLQILHKLTIFT